MQNIYLVYKGSGFAASMNNFVFSISNAVVGTPVIANSHPEHIAIYLNAARTRLLINMDSRSAHMLSITNLQGRTFYQRHAINYSFQTIDVSDFPKGVYFFNAESPNSKFHKKFVLE